MKLKKPTRFILTGLAGIAIWLIPVPPEITPAGWHLLAIFVATIVGIILQPLPMGAIAIIGITLTAASGTLTIGQSLGGFSNPVIWLIVTAFFISRGFIKTGLGERIAYYFMSIFGRHSLGLAYGFTATDLLLAPAIPSNTARSGGILFPIIRSTANVYGSRPEHSKGQGKDTAGRIGSFLMFSSFQSQNISSAMFLTAMAANPLAVQLARDQGVQISWGQWALAAALPGLLSMIAIPLIVYALYPPELKKTPEAALQAREKLKHFGKTKTNEWMMLAAFILLLFLWITGRYIGLHGTTAALLGLSFLLIFGVLDWQDIIGEKNAWNTLVWFAALVMMASFLNKLGVIPCFTEMMDGVMEGIPWMAAFVMLVLVYHYSHYFFASNTAHVSAMYVPFLILSMAAGAPPLLAALVLGFISSLFSSMTHYGTGPAPVYFGAGYITLNKWWIIGLIISICNLIIWLVVGGFWWNFLGLWNFG